MQTSLNITSVDSNNNKQTKSLTYINPNASNAELKTAAQKFNAISQNTYTEADRIIKMSVEESYNPAPKTEPTLSIGTWTLTQDTIQGAQAQITYNGDGELYTNSDKLSRIINGEPNYIFIGAQSNFSGTLHATEGNNYTAKTITFNKE